MKRLPMPVTFLVVVVATVALVIFFGAWAVSVDASGQSRGLSFAYPGSSSTMGGAPLAPGAQNTGLEASAEAEDGGSASDTWWGGAFLKACPLH